VSNVAAQARGEQTYADKHVTVVQRSGVPEATAKNIAANESSILYDNEMSFSEFFQMVNSFEEQNMRRCAIMWHLLSDEDRLQFIE
jgi:hypothetical protein